MELHYPLRGSLASLMFDAEHQIQYIKGWLKDRLPLAMDERKDHVLRQSPPPSPNRCSRKTGPGKAWLQPSKPPSTITLKVHIDRAIHLAIQNPGPFQLSWIILGIWFCDEGARDAVRLYTPTKVANDYFDTYETRITRIITGSLSTACIPSLAAAASEEVRCKSIYEAHNFLINT